MIDHFELILFLLISITNIFGQTNLRAELPIRLYFCRLRAQRNFIWKSHPIIAVFHLQSFPLL